MCPSCGKDYSNWRQDSQKRHRQGCSGALKEFVCPYPQCKQSKHNRGGFARPEHLRRHLKTCKVAKLVAETEPVATRSNMFSTPGAADSTPSSSPSQEGKPCLDAERSSGTQSPVPSGTILLTGLRQKFAAETSKLEAKEQELKAKQQELSTIEEECRRMRDGLGHLEKVMESLESDAKSNGAPQLM